MSGEEGRKLLNHEIQLVQNRIEQCLLHYMNKKEVINTLVMRDNIEPRVTELVWQRLEEENQDFFKAYYLKLVVKDQIMEFNRLLAEQVELMNQIELSGIAPILTSNGSHVSPTQQISTSCAPPSTSPLKADDMQQQQNVFNNCGPSIPPYVQGTIDGSVHCRKMNVSPSLFLSQNPNMGLSQTMNRKMVKTEGGGYGVGSSSFNFSPPNNYLESRPLMGDPSVSSFSSVDSTVHHHMNDTILDGDASSFGFLPPIPQSFPHLPADVTSSDLLESYCRFPFQATDANNFMDPNVDMDKLDPASESLRYQCFDGV